MKTLLNRSYVLSPGQIKEGLADRKWDKVAEGTGLSYQTVRRMANGSKAGFSIDSLLAVSKYLRTPFKY